MAKPKILQLIPADNFYYIQENFKAAKARVSPVVAFALLEDDTGDRWVDGINNDGIAIDDEMVTFVRGEKAAHQLAEEIEEELRDLKLAQAERSVQNGA
jgi:hypothetical protein